MAVATATAIALALAAASAGASAYNTRQTANRADSQAASGIRTQAENQRQVNERINKTLEQTKAQDPEETRSAVNDKYLNTVRAKLGQARAGLNGSSGLSSAYDSAAAGAGEQIATGATDTAGLMARMDAPGQQRQNEGFQFGDLGMNLDVMGGNVRGDHFMNQLRMQGIRRNPWIDAAAGVMGGAATGVAGSGGAGGYGNGYSAANTGTIAPIAYQNQNPWALPIYASGGG